MLYDHHQHKRPEIQNCESCRFYMRTPTGDHGNCHRFPPPSALSGHVTVYPDGWCGEYRADPFKLEELGKDHLPMRKKQAEVFAADHKKRGEELKAAQPKPQNSIATKPLK